MQKCRKLNGVDKNAGVGGIERLRFDAGKLASEQAHGTVYDIAAAARITKYKDVLKAQQSMQKGWPWLQACRMSTA